MAIKTWGRGLMRLQRMRGASHTARLRIIVSAAARAYCIRLLAAYFRPEAQTVIPQARR